MNTYPNTILRTERGTLPDYDLADRYRAWLLTGGPRPSTCHLQIGASARRERYR
jgi:hypothetical protein